MNTIRNDIGFTLIELMIAMAIFAIVITGIYQSYTHQQMSYMVQEQTAGMQQNFRAGMLMISKDLRQANCFLGADSHMETIAPNIQKGIRAFNDYDYTLSISDSENWDNGSDTGQGPDRVDVAFANVRTHASILDGMSKSSAELKCRPEDAGPPPKFVEGDIVVISNGNASNVMEITHEQEAGGKWMLQHNPGKGDTDINNAANPNFPVGGYAAGSLIFKLKYVSYAVDTITNANHPRLMVDLDGYTPLGPHYTWQPVAHNIEDLQFIYIFSDGTEADFPDDAVAGQTYDDVRAVRVRILARSDRIIPGYTPRPTPDRDGNTLPQDFIRRWYETNVKLRNLGLNPVPEI